jgi:ribosomal protein S27E
MSLDWDDDSDPDFDEAYDVDYGDDDDSESLTISCPECGAEVYEDAVRCPVCDNYIVAGGHGSLWAGRPAWWIILGMAGIIAVVLLLSGVLALR